MVATAREDRRWPAHARPIASCVPAEPLVRALLDTAEAAAMRNAVGRCRPLSASGPRLVVLLAGRPFDLAGVVPEVRPLSEVADELGVPVPALDGEDARRSALEAANEARIVERAAKLEALRALLAERPDASRREMTRALRVDARTLRRLLAELTDTPSLGLGALVRGIRERLEVAGQIGHTSDRETRQRVAEVSGLPNASEVRAELSAEPGRCPDERSVRRALGELKAALASPSGVLAPRRSDHAASLARVLRAVSALLERREAAPAPVVVAPLLLFAPCSPDSVRAIP